MKEIRETKMVEQTTVRFVSSDGNEFDDAYLCEAHERSLTEAIVEEKFKAMTRYEITSPFNFSESFIFFEINSDEDLITLLSYSEIFGVDGVKSLYEEKKFKVGEKYILYSNNDYSYVETLVSEFKTGSSENCATRYTIFDWGVFLKSVKEVEKYFRNDTNEFKETYPDYEENVLGLVWFDKSSD